LEVDGDYGILKAKKAGNATITLTLYYEKGKSVKDTCDIAVVAAPYLTVSPQYKTLTLDGITTKTLIIISTNMTGYSVDWIIDNPDIVTVSKTGSNLLVEAQGTGTATICIIVDDSSGTGLPLLANVYVTVKGVSRDFTFIGTVLSDNDFTSFMNDITFTYPLSFMGHGSGYWVSKVEPNNAKWFYDRSGLFIALAHGSQESILLGNDPLYASQIDSWQDNSLSHMKLVLYGSCSSGQGGITAHNIVNSTYNKGAQTVIGFQDTVVIAHMNTWAKEFVKAAGDEYTIRNVEEACAEADFWVGFHHLFTHGGTDNRLIRGSTEYCFINQR